MRSSFVCIVTASGARRGIALLTLGAVVAAAAATDVAVSLNPALATTRAYPWGDSNHGWEFTVNYMIEVTHIGMLDLTTGGGIAPDGFLLAHDVGLFRMDGALLTAGTLSPGTGDMLLDNFRYVPVSPVMLSPGEHYAVVYYAATNEWPTVDETIAAIPSFQASPAINYVAARSSWGDGSLALPSNQIDPNNPHPYCFGTNFLFVPEPGTLFLLGLAGAALLRRRA